MIQPLFKVFDETSICNTRYILQKNLTTYPYAQILERPVKQLQKKSKIQAVEIEDIINRVELHKSGPPALNR